MANCLNTSNKEIAKLVKDFGEVTTSKLLDDYFPNNIPSYEEFIKNKNIQNELGIIPISKVKSELNKSYPSELSNNRLIGLKKVISALNNKLQGHVYQLFNINQVGQSDNYTWGLRKIAKNVNLQAKLERAKNRITDTGQNLSQVSKLEELNNQLGLFDNPSKGIFYQKSNNVEIKTGVQELFEENPELANEVYEALGFKSKPDVILPIGTSGSGKSTFIKSLPQENLVVIEPDTMRVEFTGDMNNKSKDKEIYIEAAKRAVSAIKAGKQVVFDTTNLTKDKRLPFIEAIKKAIPTANIQYKLMPLNPELAKQRIKADIAAGKNRANVPDSTIDRHAESYKQMLEDIKSEPISNYEITPQQKQQAQQLYSNFLSNFVNNNFDTIIQDLESKNILDKKCS